MLEERVPSPPPTPPPPRIRRLVYRHFASPFYLFFSVPFFVDQFYAIREIPNPQPYLLPFFLVSSLLRRSCLVRIILCTPPPSFHPPDPLAASSPHPRAALPSKKRRRKRRRSKAHTTDVDGRAETRGERGRVPLPGLSLSSSPSLLSLSVKNTNRKVKEANVRPT